MKRKEKLCSQRGATLPSVLLFSFLAIAVGAAALDGIFGAKKLRAASNNSKMVEQRHNAALTKAKMLVATGALYYDSAAGSNVLRIAREHTACDVRAACPADWESYVYYTTQDVWHPNLVTTCAPQTCVANYNHFWALHTDDAGNCNNVQVVNFFGAYYIPCVNLAGSVVSIVGTGCPSLGSWPIWAGHYTCWREHNNFTGNTCTPGACTTNDEGWYDHVTVANTGWRKRPPAPPPEVACDGSGNIPSSRGWCFLAHDRAGGDGLSYMKVAVCEQGTGPQGVCAAGQNAVPVNLKFASYKVNTATGFKTLPRNLAGELNVEFFGNVEIESVFQSRTMQTTAAIPLGDLTGQKKLEKNVSDTDFCYFMKPVTANSSDGSISYQSNGEVGEAVRDLNGVTTVQSLGITALQPRAEGRDAGEFAREWTIPGLSNTGASAYSVVPDLRQRVLERAETDGYRGLSVVLTNNTRDARVFMGVKPNQGSTNGPQFRYFLSDNNAAGNWNAGSGPFDHAYRCSDPALAPSLGLAACNPDYEPWKVVRQTGGQSPYSAACGNTTGVDADFCTRVDMPLGTFATNFAEKCELARKDGLKSHVESRLSAADLTTYSGHLSSLSNAQAWLRYAVSTGASASVISNLQSVVSSRVVDVNNFVSSHSSAFSGVPSDLLSQVTLPVGDAISCNPDWPQKVREITNYISNLPNGPGGHHEVYINEVAALIDLDEGMLESSLYARVGSAAKNFVVQKKKEIVSGMVNLYAGGGAVARSSFRLSSTGESVVVDGHALYHGFDHWVKSTLPSLVNIDSYSPKRCVYMRYHDIANPHKCKVSMIASEESALACRTSDGCFAGDTLIRMADGSEKVISLLRRGDLVWNPISNMAAAVEKVTVGPEKIPMLRIVVEGSSVEVTVGHPFMSPSGWKKASELREGDLVMSNGMLFRPIQSIETLPVGQEPPVVWNIAVEGSADSDHYVLANGVVTGDLFIQNQIGKR